jgi:5-methyltetrahydropteroyltriglutamate--homocysteine methyltransferase
VVGSLLRPDYLREAREAALAGTIGSDELRAAEDRAVLDAIALQEGAGIGAITDGEYRRHGWIALIPIVDDPLFRAPVSGFEFLDADSGWRGLWKTGAGEPADTSGLPPEEPFVTRRLEVDRDIVTDEFAFLKAHAHARPKYTIPAPSWHRIYWHPEYSTDAYPTSDDFIADVARILREHVVDRLVALGCDYVQIDAPNYAQWHIDPANRAAFEAHGHDMAHELVADAEFDSMVFEGLTGVTRAMHMCRGNAPGGMWLPPAATRRSRRRSSAARERRPAAARVRQRPRRHVRPSPTSSPPSRQLRLVTTKDGTLEDPEAIAPASRRRPSTPSSTGSRSAPSVASRQTIARTMTLDEQEAKLRLVGEVARRVWSKWSTSPPSGGGPPGLTAAASLRRARAGAPSCSTRSGWQRS